MFVAELFEELDLSRMMATPRPSRRRFPSRGWPKSEYAPHHRSPCSRWSTKASPNRSRAVALSPSSNERSGKTVSALARAGVGRSSAPIACSSRRRPSFTAAPQRPEPPDAAQLEHQIIASHLLEVVEGCANVVVLGFETVEPLDRFLPKMRCRLGQLQEEP